MEMEAADDAWKARFRERVLQAHARLSMTVWKIGNARGSLAGAVRAPATDATRARILLAEQSLEAASSDLAAAASLLRGAEELALRGGAYDPCCPVPCVGRLLNSAAAQRRASRKLREAMLFEIQAYTAVPVCCVDLACLRLLLGHPHLPGVDGFLEAKRLKAFNLLKDLMDMADACVSLVKSARKDVS